MEYLIDAKNKKLGRLASDIAMILQGKKNSEYNPKDSGKDKVVVENIKSIVLTGRKPSQKVYYHHSGPLGHLKVSKYRDVFEKNPGWILRHAVSLMLPKNRLRAERLKRLTVK